MSKTTCMIFRRLVHSNTCTKNKIWQIAVNGNEKQYNLLIYNNTLLKLFMCNCAIQKRTIFSLLLPYNRKSDRKIYRDRKLIGYSPEQIFDVIQDTENYKRFLPFCRQSIVKIRKDNYVKTFLEIGFPPIIENYMSHVTFQRPHVIRAECREGNLFNHLVTQWNCNPGLNNKSNTCVINFFVSYEFKSQLHSKLTNMFFNELVKQMEQAFFDEAAKRYGQPSIKAQQLKLFSFREH